MLRSPLADLVCRGLVRRLTAVAAGLTLAVTGGAATAGACGSWPGGGRTSPPSPPRAPAPAPASAPDAAPPAADRPATRPVDTMFHGLWTSYTDEQRAQVLDRLQAAGVTSVRIDLSWIMLQPDGPQSYYGWGVDFVDRVIAMANERNIRPLMTLWLTPAWANGNAGERVAPYRAEDYARVAGWAANRWRGKVVGWEVWNEPNSDAFLRGADPAAYARLLQAAYPAIKAGDPNAAVVFGGVEYNDVDWLRRAYDAGAKGSFDVLATHPYQGIADLPPDALDGTKWTMRSVSAVRELMVERGDEAKPIWFTEFGWSTHGDPVRGQLDPRRRRAAPGRLPHRDGTSGRGRDAVRPPDLLVQRPGHDRRRPPVRQLRAVPPEPVPEAGARRARRGERGSQVAASPGAVSGPQGQSRTRSVAGTGVLRTMDRRPVSGVDTATAPATLVAHLDSWLGRWPPAGPLDIVGSADRERPGWDGTVYPALAVAAPRGAVLSVPRARVAAVSALAYRGPEAEVLDRLGPAVGRRSLRSVHRVFRWCTDPAPLPAAGAWLPAADPRVPDWMRPFGGEVLVALDDGGGFLGGVGIKWHDRRGGELAVVTARRARGRGLGRRLIAQAARRVLDEGAVPTYLHQPDNVASARAAAAAGFADCGWTAVLALSRDPLRVRLRRLAGRG